MIHSFLGETPKLNDEFYQESALEGTVFVPVGDSFQLWICEIARRFALCDPQPSQPFPVDVAEYWVAPTPPLAL